MRRAKVFLDSQMDLNLVADEPAAATFGKFSRFLNLGHSENVAVECSRLFFLPSRHRKLRVVNRAKRCRCIPIQDSFIRFHGRWNDCTVNVSGIRAESLPK